MGAARAGAVRPTDSAVSAEPFEITDRVRLSANEDQTVLGNASVIVTIAFEIPDTADRAFTLGARSAYGASTSGASARLPLTGMGTVSGRSVTVTLNESPDLDLDATGELYVEDSGPPMTVTGMASRDGDHIMFSGGGLSATFTR